MILQEGSRTVTVTIFYYNFFCKQLQCVYTVRFSYFFCALIYVLLYSRVITVQKVACFLCCMMHVAWGISLKLVLQCLPWHFQVHTCCYMLLLYFEYHYDSWTNIHSVIMRNVKFMVQVEQDGSHQAVFCSYYLLWEIIIKWLKLLLHI
jgi:hypothetical protein